MRQIIGKAGSLIASMSPAYFALVMSTGIVSIACHVLGFRYLAVSLFWLNIGLYVVLWLLFLNRLAFYHRKFWPTSRVIPGEWDFLPSSPGPASWAVSLFIVGSRLLPK